jgi:hypothetical protein
MAIKGNVGGRFSDVPPVVLEVLEEPYGRPMLRGRGCGTMVKIDVSARRSSDLPYVMATSRSELFRRANGWAIVSLALGVLSMATPVPVAAAVAIMTGLVALRRLYAQYSMVQAVMAFSGMVLGGASIATIVVRMIR